MALFRSEIERLRDDHTHAAAPRVPYAERAREASLRQRNTALLTENQRLRQENAALWDELALVYGQRREALGSLIRSSGAPLHGCCRGRGAAPR